MTLNINWCLFAIDGNFLRAKGKVCTAAVNIPDHKSMKSKKLNKKEIRKDKTQQCSEETKVMVILKSNMPHLSGTKTKK